MWLSMRDDTALAVSIFIAILMCGPSSINGETDQTDANALRSLYSSLNSPGQLTKWTSTGGDPCGESWKGIGCSGSRVTAIKLSGLGLSGSNGLGYQLASMTGVQIFDISNNYLGNQIPYQLPPNVEQLNLAGCGFNGGVPYSISQMTSLKYLNLGRNQLNQLTDIFGQLSALSTMDLSFNSFTGDLPGSFSSLTSLTNLYLQNNQFTGKINVLANLPLRNLNVENNQFTGWVPEQLKGINLQKGGNSWNSGAAPPPPPGTPPLPKNDRNRNNNSSFRGKKSGIGGGAVAGIVISLLVVVAMIVIFVIIRRRASKSSSADIEKHENEPFAPLSSHEELKAIQGSSSIETKRYEPSLSIKPPPSEGGQSFDEDVLEKPMIPKKAFAPPVNTTKFSIADLQIATGSFSTEYLISEGSTGRVYRAHFDDGKVLAVEKINTSSALPIDSSEDFLEIVSDISRLQHPNITELVGYCSEHGQHLLVYEFHKNGSLHDFLHLSDDDYTKPLTWNGRVKIALGTARALEYLHEVCSPSVVHKNFKSANILLDKDLNPHLSASGLANLVPDADLALNDNDGSGYRAPEVEMSGQYTIKSDVYSFGVVMLELLSGRKPYDSFRPRSEQSLVRWAAPQLHDIDSLSKMVDPALKGLYPVKSLSRFADVIALCVQSEPEFRPPMSEVVQALVLLVQRANMSKRTIGSEHASASSGDSFNMRRPGSEVVEQP
ncbi:protein STRUBBELIG-RECEPTOR FAMILY 7-like [Impatiens glandulifera]|uniref:protein STRUBBELIG-RECEPTOR FAMILY 7-like n=1 Tax=Impatiens glandulifera TaxID=253017 RepID=UPI001FB1666B|nr:protein STRUBBELIG-RECEPTOR FAMILY 7-like [Impatiens glandulifera]